MAFMPTVSSIAMRTMPFNMYCGGDGACGERTWIPARRIEAVALESLAALKYGQRVEKEVVTDDRETSEPSGRRL